MGKNRSAFLSVLRTLAVEESCSVQFTSESIADSRERMGTMKHVRMALACPLVLMLPLVLLTTGCNGGGDGAIPDLSGTWYGEGPIDGHHVSYTLTMETVQGQLYHAVAVVQSSTLGDCLVGIFTGTGNMIIRAASGLYDIVVAPIPGIMTFPPEPETLFGTGIDHEPDEPRE